MSIFEFEFTVLKSMSQTKPDGSQHPSDEVTRSTTRALLNLNERLEQLESLAMPAGTVVEVPKGAGKFVGMCKFKGEVFLAYENGVYRAVKKDGEYGLVKIAFSEP